MPQFEPQIVAYCCQRCVPSSRVSPNVHVVQFPCAARVEIIHLLRAIENEADGACIVACPEGDCQYYNGNTKAAKRVQHVKKVLQEIGVEPERVEMVNLPAQTVNGFPDALKAMVEKVRAFGPGPMAVAKAA